MKTLISIILIVVIILIVLWWFLRWATQSSTLISGYRCASAINCKGKKPLGKKGFPVSKLGGNPSSSNYTISLWYYVDRWTQTKFPKVLFNRTNLGVATSTAAQPEAHSCPRIELGKDLNNLSVTVSSYAYHDDQQRVQMGDQVLEAEGATPDEIASMNQVISKVLRPVQTVCSISNVPLQKWVNVLVSVYGRSIDVYVDGKLVKTCIMPGPAISSSDGIIHVTPSGSDMKGTFTYNNSVDTGTNDNSNSPQTWSMNYSSSPYEGHIDGVRYWDTATNPQQAYNIYKDGPGGGGSGVYFLPNLLNKYYIKVQFMDDGTSQFGFEI